MATLCVGIVFDGEILFPCAGLRAAPRYSSGENALPQHLRSGCHSAALGRPACAVGGAGPRGPLGAGRGRAPLQPISAAHGGPALPGARPSAPHCCAQPWTGRPGRAPPPPEPSRGVAASTSAPAASRAAASGLSLETRELSHTASLRRGWAAARAPAGRRLSERPPAPARTLVPHPACRSDVAAGSSRVRRVGRKRGRRENGAGVALEAVPSLWRAAAASRVGTDSGPGCPHFRRPGARGSWLAPRSWKLRSKVRTCALSSSRFERRGSCLALRDAAGAPWTRERLLGGLE